MDRLTALRQKLAARENTPGYEENVRAIRVEIERLERAPTPQPK